MLIRTILTTLAMPPALNLLLVVLGFVLVWRFRVLGRLLMAAGILSLAALALPWVKSQLYQPLEIYPALQSDRLPALDPAHTAIVVLGGGTIGFAEEFQQEALKANSLQRVYYASHLLQSVSLPVLITGGMVFNTELSEAYLMGQALTRLGTPPRWLEQQSRTTWENAVYTAKVLQAEGVDTIVLVTDAWHMRRSVESFHAQGFNVLPAPTGFRSGTYDDVRRFVPESYSLDQSRDALHEWLGILVYRISYGTTAAPAPDARGVVPGLRQSPATAMPAPE